MHQIDELLCGCRLSFPCSNFQGHPFPNHIIKCSSLDLKRKKKELLIQPDSGQLSAEAGEIQ